MPFQRQKMAIFSQENIFSSVTGRLVVLPVFLQKKVLQLSVGCTVLILGSHRDR